MVAVRTGVLFDDPRTAAKAVGVTGDLRVYRLGFQPPTPSGTPAAN
jgi:hypothetical protein